MENPDPGLSEWYKAENIELLSGNPAWSQLASMLAAN